MEGGFLRVLPFWKKVNLCHGSFTAQAAEKKDPWEEFLLSARIVFLLTMTIRVAESTAASVYVLRLRSSSLSSHNGCGMIRSDLRD